MRFLANYPYFFNNVINIREFKLRYIFEIEKIYILKNRTSIAYVYIFDLYLYFISLIATRDSRTCNIMIIVLDIEAKTGKPNLIRAP